MDIIIANKKFPEILAIARSLISNKELAQRAIAIIYNMLTNNRDPDKIGESGAVDFVIELFKVYNTDPVLGLWTCAVLGLLTKSEKSIKMFTEKDGFTPFFKLYRYSFDTLDLCDKVMNSTATLCMSNFPSFPGTDSALLEILDLSFEILDRNKTRLPTCGYASITVSFILRFPLKNNRLFFFGKQGQDGGAGGGGEPTFPLKKKLSLLLGVLKRYDESKELCERITLLLCNIFINAKPNERPSKDIEDLEIEMAKHVGEEGGIELLLEILKRNFNLSISTCENATAALQNLTIWKENLDRIVKAGGTNIVLQGLRDVPADKIQAKGFLQTLYKTITSPQTETIKITPSLN